MTRRVGWLAYLAAGGLITAVAAMLPATVGAVTLLAVHASGVAAVVVGIRRNRLADSTGWRCLAGAGVAGMVGGVLGEISIATGQLIPWWAQAWNVIGYVLAVVGLTSLTPRSRGSRWESILDSGVVTVGVALPVWTFALDPIVDSGQTHGAMLAMHIAYPLFDLVLVGITARLVFVTGARTPATLLIVVANLALLSADTAYWSGVTGPVGGTASLFSMLAWLGWYMGVGAAALHPSSAQLGRTRDDFREVSGQVRLVVFLGLAVLAPTIAVIGHLAQEKGGGELIDDVVLPGLTALLAALLVLRVNLVARLAHRRAADLDTKATELTAALWEQKALQSQLTHRALHDPLTGLGNRSLLNDRLNWALVRGQQTDPVALLLLDLDGFKDINDTFGHPVGDELLVQVAQRLLGVLGDEDTLARLGGDEFAILLEDMTPEHALRLAHSALDALRVPYRSGDRQLYLTTSIGLLNAAPPATPSEALRDADLALYAAKGAGKNQVVVFEPRLRSAHMEYTRLTNGLRRAVAQNEFTLNFQPVVDLSTGAMHAVEALLRWTPPGEKPVPPNAFIPAAEATGLIVPIGEWVLDQACAEAKRWYDTHGVSVTVNVSGRQLRDSGFERLVVGTLRRYGLPPEALILEITETVLVTATTDDANTVIRQLQALREIGVRVAIDDFGTGYSSLAYLRSLPVDVLKIDRAFTSSDHTASTSDLQDWAFTKAILDLSASLDLQTVAEGVETAEQALLLRRMNCPFAQGYHFCRPVSATEIDVLLDGAPGRAALIAAA
jgi:diguanylate cyclase (GGDEF)-like protein